MNIPGFLDLRNRVNLAKWMWRWHLQSGGPHWRARNLADLRNEEDRKRGRSIEVSVMQARRELRRARNVVNLVALRMACVRRQAS
jgi:hypothetical protein